MNFFRTLAWGPWLGALLKGGIGAGASSLTAMLATFTVDPNDFQPGSAKSVKVMAVCFAFSFTKAAFLYLQNNPLPQVQTVTTVETIEKQKNPPATVTTTVQETKTT
jgi:hypothetical protein